MRTGNSLVCYALGLLAMAPASLAVTIVNDNGVEYVKEWEKLDANESANVTQMQQDLITKIDADRVTNSNRTLRDAHPKAHGCVVAKFTVNADVPTDLQTPVLTPGQSYDAMIRFSSASATPQGDDVGDARGMAVKLFGIGGPKLLVGLEDATTQDFIMINFPIFPAHNAEDFGQLVHALVENNPVKFFIPSVDPLTWHVSQAAALVAFNSKKDASLLQQRFFGLVPALINERPVKIGAIPCSNDPATRPDKPGPTFLRQELQSFLQGTTGCFDFAVQRYKDGFPIEDGMGWWPAGLSPDVEPHLVLASVSPGLKPISTFVKVARLTIPPQTFDTDAKNTYCDNMSFSPWHSIAQHRPLGGINRARRVIYKGISAHRRQANGVVPFEPTSPADYNALR